MCPCVVCLQDIDRSCTCIECSDHLCVPGFIFVDHVQCEFSHEFCSMSIFLLICNICFQILWNRKLPSPKV